MNDPNFLPPLKREQLKKAKAYEMKLNMRMSLPVLSRNEVRRFRLPFYQAILFELKEDGYVSSMEFLTELIHFQEQLRARYGPETLVYNRPQLINSSKDVDLLQQKFREAEDAHYNDDFGTEIDVFTFLGVHYGFGSEDWWWLGEQIFIQAVKISSNFIKDGNRRHTVIKYMYGKFLLENVNDREKAKVIFVEVRSLSQGQNWSAKKELAVKEGTVFVESCKLLCKILLLEAKELLNKNPHKACRITVVAQKRAIDACDPKGMSSSFMLQGMCEMACNDANTALITFLKAINLYKKMGDNEGVCEARIHVALAYLKIGKTKDALNHLETLLEFSQIIGLPYYIGQAYRFIGEYYLHLGEPNLSTPCFVNAFHRFLDINDIFNKEQAINLAAISSGQELYPKYIDLILKSGKNDSKGLDHFYKMLAWKNRRSPFWLHSSESSFSFELSLLNFIDTDEVEKSSSDLSLKFASMVDLESQDAENEEKENDEEEVIMILNPVE
ncbi:hypothetical protein FQA39_LY02093 [Lamprigera yunnana]|nr:hypothetical protein FQA39_LY02093 [Lamprigera yunnana]